MGRRHAALGLCVLAVGLGVQAAPALAGSVTVYGNDFGGAAGPEWSPGTAIITTPSGERALGPLANDAESLTLTGLPSHDAVTISFDLYVLESWDGNGPADGPDFWEADIARRAHAAAEDDVRAPGLLRPRPVLPRSLPGEPPA